VSTPLGHPGSKVWFDELGVLINLSVLRAYAAAVGSKVAPAFVPYASAPKVDFCETVRAWQASGYSPDFDLAAATGVDQKLIDGIKVFVRPGFGVPAKLNNQTKTRLIGFGIAPKAAAAFVR
jgi:hypothetical protein